MLFGFCSYIQQVNQPIECTAEQLAALEKGRNDRADVRYIILPNFLILLKTMSLILYLIADLLID